MCFHSLFESKFRASKTPPSHGFRGFAAIKAGAKKAAEERGKEAVRRCGDGRVSRRWFRRLSSPAKLPHRHTDTSPRFQAAAPPKPPSGCAARRLVRCGGRKGVCKPSNGLAPWPFLLIFQERIKDPKNASTARFQGLCCYRISSKIGRALQLPGGQMQIAGGGQAADGEHAAGGQACAQALAEVAARRQKGAPQGFVVSVAGA